MGVDTQSGGPKSPVFNKCYEFKKVDEAREAGLYPFFIPIEGSEGTIVTIAGKQKIMLGSNNYLGLTHDPRVLAKAEAAARRYGTGCTGSRLLNGTLDLHVKLEHDLAEFVGKETALVFSTGFQVNLGIISTIIGRRDTVIIDKLDHASIVDGCRLAAGETLRYRHNDMADLARVLEKAATKTDSSGGIMIVVDGLFSMEGDLSNLPEIVPLARKYKAGLMVDEAHSIGVLGPNGAGATEHYGATDDVDLLMGTFSKSFASIGGFAAGDDRVIQYVKHIARSMIFSAAMAPYAVATVQACLDIIKTEPERRQRLWENANFFKEGIKSLGYNIGPCESPIIPIMIGRVDHTFMLWKELLQAGVFCNPVSPPAVPENCALIRTSVMASHTKDLLSQALEIFKRVGKKLGVI